MVTDDFAVCAPFLSDEGGPRDDLWRFCKRWWKERFPGVMVCEGNIKTDGLFCRSHSINMLVKSARTIGARHIVIADADTIMTDTSAVLDAMRHVVDHRVLCYTHEQRWMLGPKDTAHLMSHGHTCDDDPETTGPHHNTYSGIFAVNTDLWDEVGGFDERFIGWGYEDWAFMWSCMTLGGIERAPGHCVHLWHPRKHEEEAGQPHYKDNEALFFRYRDAAGDPVAMRALLAERTT